MSNKSEKKSNRYCDWYEKATGENNVEHIAKVIFDSINNVREECKYCEKHVSFEVEPTAFLKSKGKYDEFNIFIHKGEEDEVAGLMIGNYEGYRYININYCPVCGRRLQERGRKRR